jgi:hypothetical protein
MRASATRIFHPPRQCADVAIHHVLAETQARQRLARPAVQGVAIELLEASLHFAITGNDFVHVIRTVRVGHCRLQFLQLARDDADGTGAVHHFGHSTAARYLADILAEIADRNAPIDRDLALVGLLLARDHPEKRGLAGPVGANEADLLALLERRGGFDEENLVAELLADVIETDHWGLKAEIIAAVLMPCGAWREASRLDEIKRLRHQAV